VILDTEKQQEPVKEFNTTDTENRMIDAGDGRSEESIEFVKNRVLDSLKMEVGRKLNVTEMKLKLTEDLEHVANAVSLAVVSSKEQLLYSESQGHDVEGAVGKVGTLDGEHIISAISSSVQQTSCLRKVIPVGVIVGSILAALRKYFNIAPHQENDQGRSRVLGDGKKPGGKNYVIVEATEADQVPDEKTSLDHSIKRECVESELEDASKNTVMVGAVTAAIGASALLMQQKVLFQSLHMFSVLSTVNTSVQDRDQVLYVITWLLNCFLDIGLVLRYVTVNWLFLKKKDLEMT
jgi:hypothetical protein